MKLCTSPPIRKSMYALAGCLLVILFSASSRAQQDSVSNFRFDSGQSAVKIPFELYNKLIFIRTRVNGSPPLWFLLDSGAEISVIKESSARTLGLEFEGKGNISAAGGSVDFLNVKNVTFSLPGADILNPKVVSFPLETFEPILGRTADGILGADLFNRFVVEIDYANQTINLFDPGIYHYSGKGTVLPMTVKENSLFVQVFVTQKGVDTIQGVFQIDTGSDSTIVLNGPFARAHKLVEPTNTIESNGLGAGGTSRSLVGRVERIEIGRFVMKNPVVRFSQDENGDLASGDYSGIIGGELLRRFRVIVDNSNGRLILESNVHLTESDEFDMSGITFSFEPPDFKILKVDGVMRNSPAAEAGLTVGDIVTAIDSKPVSKYNSDQLRKMFKKNGRMCSLVIKRGSKVLRIGIRFRRLI